MRERLVLVEALDRVGDSTAMTADRHAARRAVALLAVLVLSVVAALTLSAPTAVADGDSFARTGVAAIDLAEPQGVGPAGDVVPGQGRETAGSSYDSALGCCMAAPSSRSPDTARSRP